MKENKVNRLEDLSKEVDLINELSRNSTLNGVAGIESSGRPYITETFKEFKKAGVQAVICTSDSLDSTKYFA